ncbi:MAG: hypothetical protein JSV35_04605 [Candidatus Bathyarchaeota archaeon]|nr:MAG: hypothetical protein JSV35_04605 [Candidatus Bathyarchaeota archaeon]
MFGERKADRNPQSTWRISPERLPDSQSFPMEESTIIVVGFGEASRGTISQLREIQPQKPIILELSQSPEPSKSTLNAEDVLLKREWNQAINSLSTAETAIFVFISDDKIGKTAATLAINLEELEGVNLVVLELPKICSERSQEQICGQAHLIKDVVETIAKINPSTMNFNDLKIMLEGEGFRIGDFNTFHSNQDLSEENLPFAGDQTLHSVLTHPESTLIETTERKPTGEFYPTGTRFNSNPINRELHRRIEMTLYLVEDRFQHSNRLSLLIPQLYEMDKSSPTEEGSQIDLDLYQMETY